jgi:hypothetical protein
MMEIIFMCDKCGCELTDERNIDFIKTKNNHYTVCLLCHDSYETDSESFLWHIKENPYYYTKGTDK